MPSPPGAGHVAGVLRHTVEPSVLSLQTQAGAPHGTLGSLQIWAGAAQVLLAKQAPARQTWVALQTVPQIPQLTASVCRSLQTPPQFVVPAVQVGGSGTEAATQLPLRHVPPAQAVPSGSLFLHLPALRFLHGAQG